MKDGGCLFCLGSLELVRRGVMRHSWGSARRDQGWGRADSGKHYIPLFPQNRVGALVMEDPARDLDFLFCLDLPKLVRPVLAKRAVVKHGRKQVSLGLAWHCNRPYHRIHVNVLVPVDLGESEDSHLDSDSLGLVGHCNRLYHRIHVNVLVLEDLGEAWDFLSD